MFLKILQNSSKDIYNILKGKDKQLKKETIKRLIQDFEGVEYDDIKDENKNISNNILKIYKYENRSSQNYKFFKR